MSLCLRFHSGAFFLHSFQMGFIRCLCLFFRIRKNLPVSLIRSHPGRFQKCCSFFPGCIQCFPGFCLRILADGHGLCLGFGCFSSLAAVIITSGLVTAGVIPVSTGLWGALGADIESTILALMTTMTASRIGRRGPVANTMWRTVTLSFTALLLATCPFIAEGFGTIPDSVIYFHVTLNLIISGTGLFIIKPFARIADRIIPEKKADAKTGGEAADLFAKENLISSGMSLNVARTELQRITGDVRNFWHDIEIMLRINPAARSSSCMTAATTSTSARAR